MEVGQNLRVRLQICTVKRARRNYCWLCTRWAIFQFKLFKSGIPPPLWTSSTKLFPSSPSAEFRFESSCRTCQIIVRRLRQVLLSSSLMVRVLLVDGSLNPIVSLVYSGGVKGDHCLLRSKFGPDWPHLTTQSLNGIWYCYIHTRDQEKYYVSSVSLISPSR